MKSLVLATALFLAPAATLAQHAGMTGMDHKATAKDHKAQATHRAVGVVKSADPKAGTVLLAHEPVRSLKWPAMTMSFKVAEPATFSKLTPGQKVEFEFRQSGSDYVVTRVDSR
jgi:Cu(I)/Ag(I) efflux system periplasmic protein CusF